jgi:hypothetical protein
VLHGEMKLSRSHAIVLVRLRCLFPAASVLRDLATFYENFTTRFLPLFPSSRLLCSLCSYVPKPITCACAMPMPTRTRTHNKQTKKATCKCRSFTVAIIVGASNYSQKRNRRCCNNAACASEEDGAWVVARRLKSGPCMQIGTTLGGCPSCSI